MYSHNSSSQQVRPLDRKTFIVSKQSFRFIQSSIGLHLERAMKTEKNMLEETMETLALS